MNGYENMTGRCPVCGAERDRDARFCSQCGAAFDEARDSAWEQGKRSFESGFGNLLYFLEQKDYVPYEQEENRFIRTNVEYYRGKFNEMRMTLV